jgi:diguanylate cyclase (GGDEF)-like protein
LVTAAGLARQRQAVNYPFSLLANSRFDPGIPRDADGEASHDEQEAWVTQTSAPSGGFVLMIVKIALLALVVEIFIMLGFYQLGMELSDWRFVLLDAGLLGVVVAIIAYVAFVGPKDRQIRAIMAALEEARLKAENLARFDVLTGTLSRRAILELLDEEVERAKRHGHALTCLMLDLDRFKTINDTHGHQFGDEVLHRIAQVISGLCRTNDHLGRYGGEEFLIILPETGIDGAIKFAERVRLAVAETCLDRHEERITISVGVTEWRDDDGSSSTLIAEADRALLEAKAAGRNHVVVNQPD